MSDKSQVPPSNAGSGAAPSHDQDNAGPSIVASDGSTGRGRGRVGRPRGHGSSLGGAGQARRANKRVAVVDDESLADASMDGVADAAAAGESVNLDDGGRPSKRPRRAATVKRVIYESSSDNDERQGILDDQAAGAAASTERKVGKIKLPARKATVDKPAENSVPPVNAAREEVSIGDASTMHTPAEAANAVSLANLFDDPVSSGSMPQHAKMAVTGSTMDGTSPLSAIGESPAAPAQPTVDAKPTGTPIRPKKALLPGGSVKSKALAKSSSNASDSDGHQSASNAPHVGAAKFQKPPGNASKDPAKDSTAPGTSKASTGAAKAATLQKKPKARLIPQASASGSKPSTPSTSGGVAAATSNAAGANFLDSLFDGAIAQTEHEKQLQKERERRAAAASSAAALKKAKAVSDKASSNTKIPLPFKTKPDGRPLASGAPTPQYTPIAGKQGALSRFGLGDSALHALLGGSRLDDIAKKRAEAKKLRQERAARGGFDLLAQGLEMAAFEGPFLREWQAHQQVVFQNKPGLKTFSFYNGKGPLEVDGAQPPIDDPWEEGEESEAVPKSLQHPWTFGAAFAYAGAR